MFDMKVFVKYFYMIAVTAFLCISCISRHSTGTVDLGGGISASCEFARYFDIPGRDTIVTITPDADGTAGRRDTLVLTKPASKIVCMSSTHVACLSAIGADSAICAVSGVRYISDTAIRRRHSDTKDAAPAEIRNPLYDIGYENMLDYERILSLAPDIVVTYSVSGAEPLYISKLRSLGLTVLVLHDYREEHPLARAEYVRLFGAMTGRGEAADSLFFQVRDRYLSMAVPDSPAKVRVLINVPYSDAWYVPGSKNYMSRLVADAGGEILGAADGTTGSGIISLEQAYSLSACADVWLNPGHCRSRRELASVHSLFPSFGPLAKGLPIYNNTLRVNSDGGNDFWESGAVRPDLVLEDLLDIFSGPSGKPLHYFLRLD